MNTFQKVSRLAVVAALSIMTNAYTYFEGMEKVVLTTIENVATNPHVQGAGAILVVVNGGQLVIKEAVEKQNPFAMAALEGVAVGTVTRNAKAGLGTSVTSLGTYGVTHLTRDTEVAKYVNNTLPAWATSDNAKHLAIFAVAAATGCYFGGVGSKLKSANSSQK